MMSELMSVASVIIRRRLVFLMLLLQIAAVGKPNSETIVKDFTSSLSSWVATQDINVLIHMETLCGTAPALRIDNTLMYDMADKYALAKTENYRWDDYIVCLQKEVDHGLGVHYSGFMTVPDEYIDLQYPGVSYVSAEVKVANSKSEACRDLFILKDEKIVKITNYIEKKDAESGQIKLEIDYLQLAHSAFADGDWQKCFQLYKDGGLRTIKKGIKTNRIFGSSDIVPYIESCIALRKWKDAMSGITDNHILINRKYWVNGKEWTLTPYDIETWSAEKAPLMDVLMDKILRIYESNPDGLDKSPTLHHIMGCRGWTMAKIKEKYVDYLWSNRAVWVNKADIFAIAAQNGHLKAMKELGKLYITGYQDMRPVNTIKGVEWLDKAADGGDAEAAGIAASFHLRGTGITADFDKAFSYYKMNENSLDFDIQYGLGLCHYYGLGTPEDKDSALRYFSKVEDLHNEVLYLIAEIYFDNLDANAVKYLERALTGKNINAIVKGAVLHRLAECYARGIGGARLDKARSDYYLAKAQEYPEINENEIRDYLISLTKIVIRHDF